MTDLLSRLNGGELIGLVAIVGGLLVGMVAIVADYWHKIRRAEIEGGLKQDMLNRGMSAEEIRTVMEAGKGSFSARSLAKVSNLVHSRER
jgi:hypothetical protein